MVGEGVWWPVVQRRGSASHEQRKPATAARFHRRNPGDWFPSQLVVSRHTGRAPVHVVHARVRPLHHRSRLGHEGHRVLHRVWPKDLVVPTGRDRIRRQGHSRRGVCPHHGHDEPRRHQPGRGTPDLPQPAVLAANDDHLCRFGHAFLDGHDRPRRVVRRLQLPRVQWSAMGGFAGGSRLHRIGTGHRCRRHHRVGER